MDLFVVLIIIVLVVTGMLAMMLDIDVFVGMFWLGLVIIQKLLAMIIKAITGSTPGWLLSITTFKIEELPLEKLTCTIRIGNFSYETSLLSMLEDDKIWP